MSDVSTDDFFKRIRLRLSFLCTKYNFKAEEKEFIGGVSIVYSRENLKILIYYAAAEWRPDVAFELFGENCSYNEFFKLDGFSKSFFDKYRGKNRFKDTMDYDLAYLYIFLKKYLPSMLDDLPALYDRLAANGHRGHNGFLYPFKNHAAKPAAARPFPAALTIGIIHSALFPLSAYAAIPMAVFFSQNLLGETESGFVSASRMFFYASLSIFFLEGFLGALLRKEAAKLLLLVQMTIFLQFLLCILWAARISFLLINLDWRLG